MLLKNSSSNFFWALFDRGGMLLMQFIALIYLSHLVSPYDFGLIAILSIFINLSNVLIDSGMMGALIKKKYVENIDYNTFFTYNLFFSVLIYLILFFSAPLIANFYHIPSIILYIRILSLAIVINAFGLVQTVKLTRDLQFKTQAIITISSQILSVLLSIVIAKMGYGIWSLIALQLLHFFFSALFLSIVNKFRLSIQFSRESFKEQFSFGGPLLISNILMIINNNIYSSIIGKYYNAKDAGYFYQSNKLQNTPVGIVSAVIDKVSFTMLSKAKDLKEMITVGHDLYKYLYFVIIPIFVYFNEISEDFFIFIFGNKWIISAPIFKILCYAIIPLIIKILNRSLLKAHGETKIILALEFAITTVGLTLLIFVVSKGLHWIAYSIVLNSIIIAILSSFFVKIKLEYGMLSQFSIIVRPLILSVLSLIIVDSLFCWINLDSLIEGILKFIFYFIFIIIFNIKFLKKMLIK
ncbi:lipopolysaccharide biosynthesis protein [Halpernia sp.]|uniref:lipopolysaccharide biosynthesis protein n=1 Tax=Halpernia sp. TaxID=2782209 RepID=UPI003A8F5B8B